MCSTYNDAIYAARALRAGALGYVSKASASELLVEGLAAVAERRQYLRPDVRQSMAAFCT